MRPTGYISLPSNSKNDSENTTTKYLTTFDIPIQLEGEYEIAIVEAIYTQSWFIPVGYINYSYADIITNRNWQMIPIRFYDGETLAEFCMRVNEQVKDFIVEKIYNQRFTLLQGVKSINNEASKAELLKMNLNFYPSAFYDKINSANNKLSVIENLKNRRSRIFGIFYVIYRK